VIELISRFYDVQEGEVLIGGKNVKELDYDTILSNVAIVFQKTFLTRDSVLENIRMGSSASLEQVRAAAKEAQIDDFIMSLPDGYDTKVGSFGSRFSGGEKQRIAIAGVLAMEPECIVLDEATAMLDPVGRREVLSAVHRLNREKGITVVLITHHMNEAEDADRVVVMDDGKVIMDGAPRQVFTQVERLRSMGLTVPDTVDLLDRLRKDGLDVPLTALTVEECADAILAAVSK
jgi:ABC-type multidrug transport system fused ATPase/permease subunit